MEENQTENIETQTIEENEVKTFTQDEVNTIVQERLDKYKKKMPSKEELEEFNNWKESKKTPNEVQEELNNKITMLEQDSNVLRQQNAILKSGVLDTDDIEYIQYRVSKMEGDFEDNLREYLKNNPKFITKEEKPTTTGFSQNVANQTISQEKAYLDKKYANNPYYKK